MSDIAEKRIQQFHKIKHVTNLLLPYEKEVNRSNSRVISSLLYNLYTDLQAIEDPESIMSKVNTDLVLIPLIRLYKSMTNTEKYGYDVFIEPWLKIMHFLLSRTLLKTWMPPKFTIELFSLFSRLIGQTKQSDEIKYLAVLCLSSSLPAKYKEGRYSSFKESVYYGLAQSLQTNDFLPVASTGIVALLSVIQQDQDIKLRLESLNVLSQLLFDNIRDHDSLAVYLPGVTSKLCATLSRKGEKENHQIMCAGLKVLGELIQMVMCDEDNDTLEEINSFQDVLAHYKEDKQEPIETSGKKRNKAWYAQSKQSLANVMSQILKIRLYPDWRTRQAFVEFAYTLLSSCARTLDNCIQPLLELMVLHMDDAYAEVSNTCQIKMQLLATQPAFEVTIVPILKEELYDWIMKFPKYMISRDESEKTNAMGLITGFILLLREQSASVLSGVLDRASDGWMTALEIDKDSLNVLEEKKAEQFIELETSAEKATPMYPKIRLKHAVTDITTGKLTRLLNVVGRFCDLKSWIQHFMRYLAPENSVLNDPQAAFIVHSLLSGAFSFNADTEVNDWIQDVDEVEDSRKLKLRVITLDVLKDTMDLLTRATFTTTKSSTVTTASSFQLDEESGYILTVCFGLQIVGLTASILGQDELQDQFITLLYPLLAHLGSANVYIHTYALITLDSIALLCGLDSAKELAIQNIDYIINMISQHISVLSENARVPLVLKALIHVGGYASIGYLDDTVLEIYDALERYNSNDWLCIQLCGVLFEIVQTMERNLPKKSQRSSQENTSESNETDGISPEVQSLIEKDGASEEDKDYASMEEIGKYFLERQAEGKHDELTLEQSIMDQANLPIDLPTEDEQEVKEKKEIPLNKEELMAKEIMDRSSHFLTASSPQLRSQMLILLTSGVSILSNHPSELNQLIHSFWKPIINRLNDQQNYVVLHAARLIEAVSSISTDFLSGKFVNDLWPIFKVLLKKGVMAAKTNTVSDYSIYSLYHRTQLCLLHTLTHIVQHVPINQPVVKSILEETKYYYRNGQVQEQLANGCEALFNALATQQPDTVWFYRTCLAGANLQPPSSLLDAFVIPEWMKLGTDRRAIAL